MIDNNGINGIMALSNNNNKKIKVIIIENIIKLIQNQNYSYKINNNNNNDTKYNLLHHLHCDTSYKTHQHYFLKRYQHHPIYIDTALSKQWKDMIPAFFPFHSSPFKTRLYRQCSVA